MRSSKSKLLIIITLLFCLGLIPFAYTDAPQSDANNPTKGEFVRVANKYKCGSCHVVGDYGTGSINLSHVGSKLSYSQIKAKIRDTGIHHFNSNPSTSEVNLMAKYLSRQK